MAQIALMILEQLVDVITQVLFNLFTLFSGCILKIIGRPDLNEFGTFVPGISNMYDITLGIGWGLFILIVSYQALATMFSGIYETEGENPPRLVIRAIIFGCGVKYCSEVIWFILKAVTPVADYINQVDIPKGEALQAFLNKFNPTSTDTMKLIISIGLWIIMWNLLKLLFEIGERWVVLALLVLVAPMAFATGATKKTADIFNGWCKAFLGEIFTMLITLMVFKLMISASAINNMVNVTSEKEVVWIIVVVALGKACTKVDEWMTQIGLTTLRTGGNGVLSAATAFMAAKYFFKGFNMNKVVSNLIQQNSLPAGTSARPGNGINLGKS